ncbi:MAG: glycosyltransferase family 4 protein [Verrucomicrobia bacterium]|nr:glycosyltransferase family 4 protein [Verrucomicrobiota bacterium]
MSTTTLYFSGITVNRKRILFVDHVSKVLGGAEINLVELLGLPALRSRWEASVACAPGSPLETSIARAQIPRHAFGLSQSLNEMRVVGRRFSPFRAWKGWREVHAATRRLESIIAGARPDVVISCTNKDDLIAGNATRHSGTPNVWWFNDILSPEFFSWPVRRVFVQRARRQAARVITVSEFARKVLLDQGLSEDRVTTVHNGIPLDRYRRIQSSLLRDQLRIPPGEPLIGLVGRITPWKGQDFFLRLAKDWAGQGRPGRFVVIGRAFNEDAPFEASLKRFVTAQRLESRVHFVAFQADIASTLSQLDLLLHCSTKPEPFGRVIIEGMAVGLPVIAAAAGGVSEIITPGVDAGLATPGNSDAYLAQMTAILGSAEKRNAWSIAGRRTVETKFTLERVFQDFDRVATEVMAK